MYADDTVLFANSKQNLQKCLNGLEQYCEKWKLKINTDKTISIWVSLSHVMVPL